MNGLLGCKQHKNLKSKYRSGQLCLLQETLLKIVKWITENGRLFKEILHWQLPAKRSSGKFTKLDDREYTRILGKTSKSIGPGNNMDSLVYSSNLPEGKLYRMIFHAVNIIMNIFLAQWKLYRCWGYVEKYVEDNNV